jgi:hypothetical protein
LGALLGHGNHAIGDIPMTLAFKSDAAVDTSKLGWSNLDPMSLPPGVRKLYDAYKAQYAAASEARKAFEAAFKSAVDAPAGHEVVLGYRFGKLSYAFAPARVSKASANLVSFSAIARK